MKLCAVVKANAYGHGAEEVVAALADIADIFSVALIEEALAIRGSACGKGILVLTPPTTEEECYALIANGFIATVPSLKTAKLLMRVANGYAIPARIHLKANTGMNRYGMNGSMLGKVCKFLQREPLARVEGLYSHLYTTSREISEKQRTLFLQMQRICKRYFSSFISHMGGTFAATLGKEYVFDMARVGIGLYGYSPVPLLFPLYPAMRAQAKIIAKRRYSYGGAGYGEKTLPKGEMLFLCRYGYADGFLRQRENGVDGWEKSVNNLCMDACIRRDERGTFVDILTDAEAIATATGTIPYEVLCAATRRAEMVYDEE